MREVEKGGEREWGGEGRGPGGFCSNVFGIDTPECPQITDDILVILTANFVRRSEVIALQGPTRVCLKSEIHEIHEIQSLSRNPLSN